MIMNEGCDGQLAHQMPARGQPPCWRVSAGVFMGACPPGQDVRAGRRRAVRRWPGQGASGPVADTGAPVGFRNSATSPDLGF